MRFSFFCHVVLDEDLRLIERSSYNERNYSGGYANQDMPRRPITEAGEACERSQ